MNTPPDADTFARVMRLAAAQMDPSTKLDGEALMELLGLDSMQQVAFLKSVNTEFGTNITLEDIQAAHDKGGLFYLLAKS